MFEGKRFFPLTGTPIWKMARSSTELAVWLPEPFTVATLMLKSFTTDLALMSGPQVGHGQALRLAHVKIRRLGRHAALARGGEQELVLALVGHDVAAREDTLDRGAHAGVHLDQVVLHFDPPALHRVEVDRGADVHHEIIALEPERLGHALRGGLDRA